MSLSSILLITLTQSWSKYVLNTCLPTCMHAQAHMLNLFLLDLDWEKYVSTVNGGGGRRGQKTIARNLSRYSCPWLFFFLIIQYTFQVFPSSQNYLASYLTVCSYLLVLGTNPELCTHYSGTLPSVRLQPFCLVLKRIFFLHWDLNLVLGRQFSR